MKNKKGQFTKGHTLTPKGHKRALGYRHTKEALDKITLSKAGKKRGKLNETWVKNISHAVQERHKKRNFGFGVKEKNPKWKGGISEQTRTFRISVPYRKWRKAVLERDKHTCSFCGKSEKIMEVDHVREMAVFPKEALDISNGRTLCKDCHKRVTFGWKPEVDFREDFMKAVMELAETDKRIIFVTCDVGFSFLEQFRDKFPDRFYNFGVTEQSAALICAALALDGWRPIFYSMINFVLYRPFEMVRNGMGYHNAPVVLAGVQGSVKYKMLGFSHTSRKNEDIDLLRNVPNMRIYIPMKHEEVKNMVIKMFTESNPCYIRL